MDTVRSVLAAIRARSNAGAREKQRHFGIRDVRSYGLTQPQIKQIAREAGQNHELALALWDTGIHEARHVASMIADPARMTSRMMDRWAGDFNSWDIVDGTCSHLFRKSPLAWRKAVTWTSRKKEFEKRTGFSLMAYLAVHDKLAPNSRFTPFFALALRHSSDERNFVRKAISWALRQMGKRNINLCNKAIATAKKIRLKDDPSSRWIASDVLRELEKYRTEGRIRNVGA